MKNIKYWTDFAFNIIDKERKAMPYPFDKIIKMDDFIDSIVTEDELSKSIELEFTARKKIIMDRILKKLK